MKIIWMNIPAHGHINPTLPIVEGLVAQGAQVLYYNTEEFRAKISATGIEFRSYPPSSLSATVIAEGARTHLVKVTQLLFEVSLPLTAFMLAEIEREKPDVLVYDSICLWGMMAARLCGVPAIASITTFVSEGAQIKLTWRDQLYILSGALTRLPKLLKARSALVQQYGRTALPPKYIFPCVGNLNLVYTIRELQPPTPVINESFHFVGPSLSTPAQETTMPLPQERIVYISLGTIHTNNSQFFQSCFEAFANEPGCFVLSAGPHADQLKAPANFIVRQSIPQLEVLQRADLFITHAGINSLHESLYFGVPMVLVPQQMEQMMNARIAQMHGVGVVLGDQPPYGQHVSAAMLRNAANTVLTNPTYRAAAQQMQQRLQATNGTTDAIKRIHEFGGGERNREAHAETRSRREERDEFK